MSASVYKEPQTGLGPLNTTHSFAVPTGEAYRLIGVSCVFDSAPTTSENFTITVNDALGSVYDILLYTLDVSAASTTDILWQPDEELMLVGGDAIDVEYLNTDANTWGLVYTVKRV
jgi:hypothetical protein